MRITKHIRLLCIFLVAFAVISLASPAVLVGASDSVADLAQSSERFLSDFAVGIGGEVSIDDKGNVVFDIDTSRHSLKFKCTGDSPIDEQNAICIWLNNLTGSSRMYVDIIFMRLDGEQYSVSYEKTVENSGSDVFLFVPSVPDEFVVSISLRAAGVGEGEFSVMGIWHSFYSFPESVNSSGIGSLGRLEFVENGDSVRIEGTVLHDITISSRDSSINVYRLLPGEEISNGFVSEHEPCATSSMSRSFSFTLKNRTGADFASAYAVTVNRPDGSIEYVIEDKLYPSTAYSPGEAEGFKGVTSSLEYMPSEMSSGALMIDIDLGTFVSETLRGYLYSFGGDNYCFDSDTADSIGRRIVSHKVDGGAVYLRLTVSGDDALEDCMLYDADGAFAATLYAAVSFLCERYSGSLDGIVIGTKFDTPYAYKNLKGISYGEYVRKYADVVSVVLTAARNMSSFLKIIVPVSSNNVYYGSDEFGSDKYPMFSMLISLIEVYSMSSRGEICMMVCDETFPDVAEILGGENSSSYIRSGNVPPTKKEIMNLRAENAYLFEEFLDYLSAKYDITDKSYFYMWHPFGTHDEYDLKLAYMYNYFHLSSRSRIYSFFCDFTPDEKLGDFTKSRMLSEAIGVMGGVGADTYADGCLAEHTGASFAGIAGYDEYKPSMLSVKQLGLRISAPVSTKGTYSLVDFSSPSSLINWKKGVYAESIGTDSAVGGGRNLRAVLTLPANDSEYAEIIYELGKNADMSAVDVLHLKLRITCEDVPENTGYTVKIAIGSRSSKGVLKYTERIVSGRDFDIFADTSKFDGMDDVSYIKISVQNDSGVANRTLLHVGDVSIYSISASDDELADIFVDEEKADVGNTNLPKRSDLNTMLLVFFGFSVIAIVTVIVVRNREEESKE